MFEDDLLYCQKLLQCEELMGHASDQSHLTQSHVTQNQSYPC